MEIAVEIGLDRAVEVLLAQVLERGDVLLEGGIVDEDVELAERGDRFCDGMLAERYWARPSGKLREEGTPRADAAFFVGQYGRALMRGNQIMPAKSKKQQMAAGAALAAKRDEKSKSSLRGASKQMAKSMSKKELEKMASTDRSKLKTRKSA